MFDLFIFKHFVEIKHLLPSSALGDGDNLSKPFLLLKIAVKIPKSSPRFCGESLTTMQILWRIPII